MQRILTEPGVAKIGIWKYFELGNVGWIDKSLGCLGKKHPGYFVQEKKKKKNARKLLKKFC